MSPISHAAAVQGQDLRTSVRHVLPKGVSASMRLATGRTVFVNVRDVSRSGACVLRRGDLEIHKDDEVFLELSDFDARQKLSLACRVQWVDDSGYNTVIGLAFSQGPLLPGTLLDEYFDRPLMEPVGV